MPPLSAGQKQAAGSEGKHQGSGGRTPPALLDTLSMGVNNDTNEHPGDSVVSPKASGTAAAGGVGAPLGDLKVGVGVFGGKTAAYDASVATNTSIPEAHPPEVLSSPRSRHLPLLLSSPQTGTTVHPSGSRADVLDDASRAGGDEEEQSSGSESQEPMQAEGGRSLEAPGRFADAQLLLLQQRQQQLQAHRLAALEEAGKTAHSPAAAQLFKQPVQRQTSSLVVGLQPVWLLEASTVSEPAAQRAQHAQHTVVEAAAVVSSPVVLFSPGGPYCARSKWYMSADMMQVW